MVDEYKSQSGTCKRLISLVKDRPGHDFRYSIDSSLIQEQLNWRPKFSFEKAISKTVLWYLDNQDWCKKVCNRSGYKYNRVGIKN